jgi:hypothetical protein
MMMTTTYSDLREPMPCSKMQAGITLILEIYIAQFGGVVSHDASDEGQVVE